MIIVTQMRDGEIEHFACLSDGTPLVGRGRGGYLIILGHIQFEDMRQWCDDEFRKMEDAIHEGYLLSQIILADRLVDVHCLNLTTGFSRQFVEIEDAAAFMTKAALDNN